MNKTTRDVVLEMKNQALSLAYRCDDLLAQLNHLGVDNKSHSRHVCPECGIPARSERLLAEHRYYTHDAEEPAHFAAIEARSDDPAGVSA